MVPVENGIPIFLILITSWRSPQEQRKGDIEATIKVLPIHLSFSFTDLPKDNGDSASIFIRSSRHTPDKHRFIVAGPTALVLDLSNDPNLLPLGQDLSHRFRVDEQSFQGCLIRNHRSVI